MRSLSVFSSQDAKVDTEMVITDVAAVLGHEMGLTTAGLATIGEPWSTFNGRFLMVLFFASVVFAFRVLRFCVQASWGGGEDGLADEPSSL